MVNLYSDLVSFNEDVKVRRQALSLAEKLYNDNRKQVEIGTLAPIDIVRAEAEVARSQQELTHAETQVLQQETILKNYISRTGVMSPSIADARIVPTDPLPIPDVEKVQPVQDLVTRAIQNRPELAQTQLSDRKRQDQPGRQQEPVVAFAEPGRLGAEQRLGGTEQRLLFDPTPGDPLQTEYTRPASSSAVSGMSGARFLAATILITASDSS